VTHPDHRDTPLWRVVCRSKGRTPCYLLTAEPSSTDEDAWGVVFASLRRWQIELAWRFAQSDLAEHSSTSVALAGAKEVAGSGHAGLSRLWQRYPPCFAALGRPRRGQGLLALT
jgi:hypothetical protein